MLQKSGATEIEIKIIKLMDTPRISLVNILMFMEIECSFLPKLIVKYIKKG